MNKPIPISVVSIIFGMLLFGVAARADGTNAPSVSQSYEYGMIKYDGSDTIEIITPEKSESIQVFKVIPMTPPGIHEEEYCEMWAMNHVAKEGWEAVVISGMHIMIRRAVGH